MSDGAHLGVGAERALKTILGGAPAPADDEKESREKVRARLMAAPGPLGKVRPSSYGQAADCIAKAFVLLIEEDAARLNSKTDLYDLAEAKWPGFGDWLRGPTGFQVGWATNCARWLYEQRPVPNPAIVELP